MEYLLYRTENEQAPEQLIELSTGSSVQTRPDQTGPTERQSDLFPSFCLFLQTSLSYFIATLIGLTP